ncbi:intracellular serine protease [Phlyctema vagabunda]|uniref:Intracellular serine protease n=1 Tax=Phlyctema vagabunda TaxID=108571 RepID=A0ABR4PNR4_9HELO
MAKSQGLPTSDDGEDSDSGYVDDGLIEAAAPIIQKDKVQAAFDEITKKALDGALNLGQKGNRKDFMDYYGDLLVMKTQTYNQTLLHIIANDIGHKSLTRCLLRKDKSLLEQKDDSGRTALHIAIAKKNKHFIEVVLTEIPDLDRVLRIKSEHSRNCIHMAIYHNLDTERTIKLIHESSEITLCGTDQDGLTPLHLAVDYRRSSEAQLDIVKALIAHGDRALDKFTKNPTDLSVYEYHEYTRNLATKKPTESVPIRVGNRSQEENRSGLNQGPLDSSHHTGPAATRESAKSERGQGKASAMLSANNDRRGLTIIPLNTNTVADYVRFATTPGEGNSPIKENQSVIDFEPKKLERRSTGFALNNARDDEESIRRLQEEKQRSGYADKIRQEFKLHYLRSTFRTDHELDRDQYKASRFLHGANFNNINLCFDYSKAPKLVLQESFRQSYDHMCFDEVLRYVTFSQIELQKPLQPTSESKLSKKLAQRPRSGRGRDDLTFFFDWLHKKNVRHILKVTVDDLSEPPHSDKAIIESLRKFELEILDWRRIDLCPETLYHACRDVRKLYLRWSGNRVVLRAWGEVDGLPRLEKLEQVHLVWNPERTLESADRIETYIRDFQDRLDRVLDEIDTRGKEIDNSTRDGDKAIKRKILVYRGEENAPNSELVQLGESTKILSSTNERNLQSNRWLESMDKFADEIQNIKVPTVDNPLLKNDIKVALIDDGADPYVESLRGKIKGGESFDRGYPHENGPSPYYTSARGHGTVMADMICRVCPMAKLYVYKLETHSNGTSQGPNHDQISAGSAALAVKAAINQKVDIISMSWTVKETEENRDSIYQLRDAIKLALDANILIFCAAADTGAVTEVEYPWSYDQRRIFRVGAATADGRLWGPTGSLQYVNFIVPGHKVVSRNPHREGALPDDFKERTGSSISTALAAGLSALILHCVRLGAIHTELETRQGISSSMAVKAVDFMRVKTHDNMNSVLKAIGLDEGQQKFIEVWKKFDVQTQNLKSANFEGSASGELGVIAKLARDFVSGLAGVTTHIG